VKREAESVTLPHLYPPPPKGRGRIKGGGGSNSPFYVPHFGNKRNKERRRNFLQKIYDREIFAKIYCLTNFPPSRRGGECALRFTLYASRFRLHASRQSPSKQEGEGKGKENFLL